MKKTIIPIVLIIISILLGIIFLIFTMRGTADIDDIILNSIGGCIGSKIPLFIS